MRTDEKLLLAGLFATALLYCITPVYSENIFWHLRNGEDILDAREVRTEDPFTWTMNGREWIQQEWVAEVVFAIGWRTWGPLGLMLVKTLVVLSVLGFAAASARRRGASVNSIVLIAIFWLAASQARWFERPHIFTDLFFSIYLFILSRRPSVGVSLALFIPLQILWVNMHAGFVMGLFLLFLPTADLLREKKFREAVFWLLVPFSALLATGVHPNGFRSLMYLPEFLAQPLFRLSIREWWSPFDPRFGSPFLPVLLVALTLSSVLLLLLARGRRFRASSYILLGALTVSSCFAARNAELLALASISVIPVLLKDIAWPVPTVFLSLAAAIPPLFGLPREFGPPRAFGTGMEWDIYPVGLSDFIEENDLYGRVFNTNEISGYLEYRFGERLPLYMDGRCLLYPESFYSEYLLLAQMPDTLQAGLQLSIIDRYEIEIALYDWPNQIGSTANLLAELPWWTPVYWDGLTIAYARVDYLESIGKSHLAIDLADPLSKEDLVSRPLYLIPQSMLPDLETAASMGAWDPPAVIGACLAWRAGDMAAVGRLVSELGDPGLKAEMSCTLLGLGIIEPSIPQTWTLEAWVAAADGDYEHAAETAVRMGDPQMASAFAVLGDLGNEEQDSPPPWVTESIWMDYCNGNALPGDSMAVLAASAFAAGDMDLAIEAALRPGEAWLPSKPWALATSAIVLASAGEGDALRMADSALAISRNPVTLMSKGRVQSMLGNHAEAAALFGEAASLARFSPSIALEYASSLWESGDLGGAAMEYSRARQLGAVLPPAGEVRMGWAELLLPSGGS